MKTAAMRRLALSAITRHASSMDHDVSAPISVHQQVRRAFVRTVLLLLGLLMMIVLLPLGARACLNRWGAGLIARNSTVQSMGLEVDRLGYGEAVGSAVINLTSGQRLTVTRARVRYRLRDLVQGRIDSLALSGALQLGDGVPLPLEGSAQGISWPGGLRANVLVHLGNYKFVARIAPVDGVMTIYANVPEPAKQLHDIRLKQLLLEAAQVDGQLSLVEGGPAGVLRAHAEHIAIGAAGGDAVTAELDLEGAGNDAAMPLLLTCSNAFVGALEVGPLAVTGQVSSSGAQLASSLPVPGTGSSGQFSGQIDLAEQHMKWQTTLAVTLANTNGSALSLGTLTPAGAGAFAAGAFQARAWGNQEGLGGISTTVSLKAFDLPKHGLHVADLTALCALDPANPARSLPGQLVQARALHVGALAFSDLRLRYQLEAGPAVLVEDLGASWCGGHMRASGVRIRAGTHDLDVRLLCDRLELEPLLRECGAPKVTGTGQFSGQLPVQWKNGQLSISKGFLYTTPGRGGSIAFADSSKLIAFLPASPRIRQQADMLGEALIDFAYDWITLTLESRDDYLHISASIAGKPARIIPFTYDKRTKGYVRLGKGEQGGMQAPMQLDLNFTIPFNQMLRYGVGTAAGIRKITGKD